MMMNNKLAFKFRKFQATIEQVVTEKGYTEHDFEAMGKAHNRTPYKFASWL